MRDIIACSLALLFALAACATSGVDHAAQHPDAAPVAPVQQPLPDLGSVGGGGSGGGGGGGGGGY